MTVKKGDKGLHVDRLVAGGDQTVKGADPAVRQERADYPGGPWPKRAGIVVAEGYGPRVTQSAVRGMARSLAGSFGFATSDFNPYACFPAYEAGNALALAGEMISPDVLSLAERVVTGEGRQDVTA